MVASLQSRKEALESKLREKNEELKALCIQEAELTGVLPPETPIEPGESPPSFRRRVGTAFTYPENLINKLKSKEVSIYLNFLSWLCVALCFYLGFIYRVINLERFYIFST